MKETFFPNRIIQIIGLLLAALLLSMPFLLFIGINSYSTNELNQIIFYVLVCLIFISISYWVNHHRNQRFNWKFKLVESRFLYLMIVLLFIFSVGVNKPINNLINQIFHFKTELSNPFNRPLAILGAVLIAPFLEEIIFRGIILRGLLTKYAPRYAVIFSALIFALVHGKPLQIWGVFVIGLIFGWIYYKTRSIGTTILLHSVLNLMVQIESFLIFKYVGLETANKLSGFLVIISIPLIVILGKKLLLEVKK
ncbi:type II CAAX endopeptidase family protein [uncultured Sunxiuqinia sp.]|uniref:CPBP family intramembrane glutamic endopeptidase n=1 Tax=uncultured Sunxiuqinia sp. TaxID=1573825 RepID=UPI0026039D48|nr:type II CAAX endopeptidase family protein [uncultured Sunxiuqinia sp.]